MLYVILILVPLALAAGCAAAREQVWPGVAAAAIVSVTGLVIVFWMPAAPAALWLGSTLHLRPANGLLLGSWLLMVAGVVPATLLSRKDRPATPLMLLMSSVMSTALLAVQPSLASLLLLAAMMIGSLLLVHTAGRPRSPLRGVPYGRAARGPEGFEMTLLRGEGVLGPLTQSLILLGMRYIAVAVLGALFVVAAFGISGTDARSTGATAGLVIAGLGIWMVLLPALLIFSRIVEQITLPALVMLTGVLPSLAGVLIGQAAVPDARTATGMAVLALMPGLALLLVPVSPRRLLGLLLIADSCLLLPGLLVGSDDGLRGVLIGSVAHAVAGVLMLIGIAVLEQQAEYSSRRDSISVLVLLFGLIILIGLPPLFGWYTRVALWDASRDSGVLSLLFGAGQVLLIAGAGRLGIGLLRSGPADRRDVEAHGHLRRRADLLVRVMLLLLLGATLLSGLAVRPLLDRVETAQEERGSSRQSRVIP